MKKSFLTLLISFLFCGSVWVFYNKYQNNTDQNIKFVYVHLPDIMVNLRPYDNQDNFLKLSVTLLVQNNQDAQYVQKLIPQILHDYQIYLRDINALSLKGAHGLLQLKIQLLAKANARLQHVRITDMLFREMLVQ